jgi:hypothetical protein
MQHKLEQQQPQQQQEQQQQQGKHQQLMIIDEEDAELAMINTSVAESGTGKLNMSITTIARKSTSPIKFYIKSSSSSSTLHGPRSGGGIGIGGGKMKRSKHNNRITIDEQQRVRSEFKKKLRQQTRPYFYGDISTLGALVKSESAACFATTTTTVNAIKQQSNNKHHHHNVSSQSMINLSSFSSSTTTTTTATNDALMSTTSSAGSISRLTAASSALLLTQEVLNSLVNVNANDREQSVELKREVEKLRRDFQCKSICFLYLLSIS